MFIRIVFLVNNFTLFAFQSCNLIECPSTNDISCQPVIVSNNNVDSIVFGKNSSLIYIKKRNSSEGKELLV